MVKSDRQPGRPAWKWIDGILVLCGQDIKGAMTISEERQMKNICGGCPLRFLLTTGSQEDEDKLRTCTKNGQSGRVIALN